MGITIQQVKEVISALSPDETQLLKDTILKGAWGGVDQEFLDERGEIETGGSYGYCTNNASLAGNFKGRVISSMFRSIYRKLCPVNRHQIGAVICHCNNWWGRGSGDMLFIRKGYYEAFEEWAES